MDALSVPKLPLDEWTDQALDFLTENFSFLTKAISEHLENIIVNIVDGLMYFPPWIVIALFSLIAWKIAGRKVSIFTAIGFCLLWNLRLWEPTLETLTLVIVATLMAVLLGIPMGILAGATALSCR